MSVNELLDTLFEELEASKKSFMSSKKLVDTDKCLDLIDDIRDNLPVELERAGNIIKERRQILADGEKEAQQYIEEAQRQAAQLVSETSIIKQAQQEAERSGARCALLCDRDGIVRRAGDAPLFAVRDDVIYAAPLDDVEWTLVAEAARRAGIRWVERPVGAAQLRLFDELFSFDCEGVSSIASCEGTPYLSLTAERIAAALAALPER